MTRATPHSHPSSHLTSWSCVLRCEHQTHVQGALLFCTSFFPTSPMHLLAFIISVGIAQQSANLSYSRHLYSQGYLSCSGWFSPQKYGCLPYSCHSTPFLRPGWVHNTLLNKDGKWVGKVASKGLYVGVRPNHQPPRQVTSWISAKGP